MVGGNNHEAAVGEAAVIFKVMNVSEDVVAVIGLAMILFLEIFHFNRTRMDFASGSVLKRTEDVNLCLRGSALAEIGSGQGYRLL